MFNRTAYICEYCGKAFDDKEKCIEHEAKEKAKTLQQNIKFFRLDKKEIPLDEACKNPTSVYAIYFSTTETYDILSTIFGLYATEPGFYVWLDIEQSWVNVDFLLNEMQEYKKALEKAGTN